MVTIYREADPTSCNARHTLSGEAGICIISTPLLRRAFSIAFIIAGSAPTVPASPAPFTPSGFCSVGTGLDFTANIVKSAALGIA